LWDNSTSQVFVRPETKAALNRVIDDVSNRFDYHFVLAPLLGSGNNEMKIVTRDTVGLSSSAQALMVPKSNAANFLNFSPVSGNSESGLTRARDLISSNISNGIFRPGAYQIIVLMSNEDDNSWVVGNYATGTDRRNHVNARVHELLCLRGNYSGACSGSTLNSPMMRLISITAQDLNRDGYCAPSISQFRIGQTYEMASSKMYFTPYTGGISSPTDQSSKPYISRGVDSYQLADSYDICNEDYNGIFDGVNNAIQDTVIKHHYRYWPVANSSASVDPNSISIRKSNGTSYGQLPASMNITRDSSGNNDIDQATGNKVSGFRYAGNTTINTRFLPTAGEPYTGHLIELFGDAKVTYPNCLSVSSTGVAEYFGYIHLGNAKPKEDTIEVKINGNSIPNSTINGWTLEKSGSSPRFFSGGLNIKITSPTDFTPALPALNKGAGYYIRLHGSAVYTNSATIEFSFLPLGN
jgi:hypothetical protein